jgi:hypothetical protein
MVILVHNCTSQSDKQAGLGSEGGSSGQVERNSPASCRTVWTFVSGEVTGVGGAEVSVRNDDGKTVMAGGRWIIW